MKKFIFIFLTLFTINSHALFKGFTNSNSKWECINKVSLGWCNTWRMKVFGGWLVEGDHDEHTFAMTFVPDAKHEWSIE